MSFQEDPFGRSFRKVTPPRHYTFSHRKMPCSYEPSLPQASGTNVAATPGPHETCPFRVSGFCKEVEDKPALRNSLAAAYKEHFKCLLAETSTNVVIRSEQQFHQKDMARLAHRRHFYEVVSFRSDPGRFGVGCTKIDSGDRFGEYLGFVDLRLHFNVSPLAFGLLVEPSWVREEPLTFVIRGDYGPLFGAHSFRSSIYAMQDTGTIGAMCAQMSAIMAVGMLADRGADVKGSFTLTYLAWKVKQYAAADLVGDAGLSPEELLKVLKQCRVEAQLHRIKAQGFLKKDRTKVGFGGKLVHWLRAHGFLKKEGTKDVNRERNRRRLIVRIIEANLYARFPVIMAVSSGAWNRAATKPEEPHAVVVVGVRRHAASREPAAFIIHCPGSGPFKVMGVDRVLDAALRYQDDSTVHFIAVTEKSLAQPALLCAKQLMRREQPYSDGRQLFRDYYEPEQGVSYEIRLLNRGTILLHLALLNSERPFDDDARQTLEQALAELPDSRFWVFTGMRQSTGIDADQVCTVWIFDAISERGTPPILTLQRTSTGRFEQFRDKR